MCIEVTSHLEGETMPVTLYPMMPFQQAMLLGAQIFVGMMLHAVNPFAAAYYDSLTSLPQAEE